MSTIQFDNAALILQAKIRKRLGVFTSARVVFRAIALWLEKRRSRAALHTLTDDQLQDIGLTRQQAEREVSKSFFWN